MPGSSKISNAALAWLFFFSGLVALVYEAIWQRRFSLVFGSAAPATAAVLAAYFAGLAVGSFFIGKRVHQFQSPLRLYAGLEFGIFFGALLVEPLLSLFDTIPLSTLPTPLLLTAKTFLAFVALALPTFCMGGTLPALGAFIDRGEHHLGRTAGFLYVANTTGAALGILAFPFLLLPMFGARTSLIICAVINLLIAAIAYRLAGNATIAALKPEPSAKPPCPQAQTESTVHSLDKIPRARPLLLAFVSGLISFIAQVLWNRAFAQIHENSIYSFAIIVAIFIAALAFGGQIARLLLSRAQNPQQTLGKIWIVAGFVIGFTPLLFLKLTHNLAILTATSWIDSALHLTALALALVFPTAALIGIAFPLIMQMADDKSETHSGEILGRLLSINLLGSVGGALLGGFVLPAFQGLWRATVLNGIALVMFGMLQLPKRSRWIAAILAILVLNPIFRLKLPQVRINEDRGEKLVAISEGAHGIVAVVDQGNSRRLKLNNSYVLGGTASTGDERMQSHIPLLLHPNPQRVAYMGLGTGISAGASFFHPVKQVTILELVPEVADAARVYFAKANVRILDQPNTRLVVEDARNYLRHSDAKFDVIIGDLVVPWKTGEAALFTRENFLAGKNSLAPGGLFCQWLPMFQLSEDQFRILLNTFLSVFPEAFIWRADFSPTQPAFALIGFADDKTFSAETIRNRLAQLKHDPANPHLINTYAIWMNFIGSIKHSDINPKWRINSEDRPWVELLGPISATRQNSFVGRPLQNWCRELNAVSMSRFNAGELEAAAMNTGDLLFDFTLALSENNQPAATRAQSQLQQLLPPALYTIVFPQ